MDDVEVVAGQLEAGVVEEKREGGVGGGQEGAGAVDEVEGSEGGVRVKEFIRDWA